MTPQTDRTTAAVAILTALLCLVLTAIRANPPAPKGPTEDGSFSAISAQRILEHLYASGVTHHIGTENNRILKEQILSHLRLLGYEPTVQSTMACWQSDGCGHVENILARLPGKGTGKAVLLAVHYDSVGAGPSVSDDGVAVAATLEIARILKSEPRPDNDIIFLIDDGEEANLLGAAAFAAKHPWADEVGAVINLEARGSSGRSYMFETGTENAWLIDQMKRHVPRPASSSFYYSIYQRLPNDTDFTVFKHYGMNGVNFAFIGNVVHYHTPLDDLAHATPATMQHHGDNALAMVRALANADLTSPSLGTASWFDLWGLRILSWPENWNLPLSIIGLLLMGIVTGLSQRRGLLGVGQVWRGLVLYPMALLGGVGLSLMTAWILKYLGGLPDWPATTWMPKGAFWLIGIATSALVISFMGRKAGSLATWLGSLMWLALLAIVVSMLLPGAAYLFLVPALVGGILTVPVSLWAAEWLQRICIVSTVVIACATQMILAWSLWEAMGILIMPLVVLLVTSLTTLTLAPAAGVLGNRGHKGPLLGLALAGVFVVASLLAPPYSRESPRALNFYFVQDSDGGSAKLAVRPGKQQLPIILAEAAKWEDELQTIYPWMDTEPATMIARADTIPVSPPQIEILATEDTETGRRIRGRLSSPRRADRGAVVFRDPLRIESLFLEGWEPNLQTAENRTLIAEQRWMLRFATMPDEGIGFDLTLTGTEPFEAFILDYSFGLPSAGDSLTKARPTNMVPIGQGDLTIVHSRAML